MKTNFLQTKQEIIDWLEQYNIENYTLIPDEKYGFVVDVDNDVILVKKDLQNIPIKFNIINGNFDCSYNKLNDLNFCPIKVKNFYCDNNNLINLLGSPEEIDGNFFCHNNKLKTLDGCLKEIKGSFFCGNNKLIFLKFCPEIIHGKFDFKKNKLKDLRYFPNVVYGKCSDKKYDWFDFSHFYEQHLQDLPYLEKKILTEKLKNNINPCSLKHQHKI